MMISAISAGVMGREEPGQGLQPQQAGGRGPEVAEEAYTLLALTCTGQAQDYIKTAERNNGFDAWRRAC